EPVIIGGTTTDFCYADFQDEMNMLNRAFLEVMCEGDAKGRVFTFPIPTYNIDRDFEWDDPKLEWLWKVTARYGVPYFANFIHSDMSPEDARSMCCRLRLDMRKLEARGGGLFGSNPLTGSIGVVTMNLPRLGYTSQSEEQFMRRLDRLMDRAAESLEIKRKVLERTTEGSLYPYARFYLRQVKSRHGSYWHNHFSTIGLVGMNEACRNLLGCGIADERGAAFAKRVLDHMRERLSVYQERTGHFYNLEATPAEGTSYRLALKDRERYPDILCAGSDGPEARPFYTNSSQLPVDHTDDVWETLDHQDDLQTRYTGGTVVHVFVGEELDDCEAVKNFVRKVCYNYRLPYFTISPTFSICPQHGYRSGQQPTCPDCGSDCEVYARVVGYLRPVEQWNEGKQEEFRLRSTARIEG
ncbi:MAG: ribonucleoside triphosphate reductase, partial [Planctomycetota bacterium]